MAQKRNTAIQAKLARFIINSSKEIRTSKGD